MSVFTLTDQIRIQKAMLQLKGCKPVAVMLANSDTEGLEMEVEMGVARGLTFPGNGQPMKIQDLPVIRGHMTGILVALPRIEKEDWL